MTTKTITIGTRGSDLALWQAHHVADLLRVQNPQLTVNVQVFTTKGDVVLDKALPVIGGKGLFTAELEQALITGVIDCAVHSLKDLPTDNPAGLTVGAIPERAHPADVLVSRDGHMLADLPQGATVGTSSRRRAAQLLKIRPDLNIIDIRGNVPTRISKTQNPAGDYDATILARAGVERLGLMHHTRETLPMDVMLCAPGQGAIGVQCRDDAADRALIRTIDHTATRAAVTAERAFLNELEGGCSVPVAAHATLTGDDITLTGRVIGLTGTPVIDVQISGHVQDADAIGRRAAQQALERGAGAILSELLS